MPRVNGVMQLPPGSYGAPNTTIKSAPYNTVLDDFVNEMNGLRPITAGGTGAGSASQARTNLALVPGTNVQAYDALLQSIAGLTTSANQIIYLTATDTAAVTTITTYGRSLIDDADAATARGTLGLGTMATQAANNVAITGGSVSGITDLAIADGGTGASTASAARNNLGLGTAAVLNTADANSWAGLQTFSNGIVVSATAGVRFSNDDFITYDDGTNTYTFSSDGSGSANTWIEVGKIRLVDANDASPVSTNHPFQIGPTSGANLRIDNNEIMAVNNGVAAQLIINNDGGDVAIGDATSTIAMGGPVTFGAASATRTNLGLGGLATLGFSDLVYSGSTAGNLNFPIGTVLPVYAPSNTYVRTQSLTVYLYSTNAYSNIVNGTALTGTWRWRGPTTAAGDFGEAERTN